MNRFFSKRGCKPIITAVLILVFLLLVLPYLVPVASPESRIPTEALVAPSGRFLNTGSGSIYVEDQGPPSEKAVVLIHGFGGSTYSWRDNIPFLAEHEYRVIALDLRGFGLSSRQLSGGKLSDRNASSGYSHKSQAMLVAEVLRQLEVKRAYLIGHSMGTSVMLHLAHLHPEMVLGMISVDGAVNLRASSQFLSGLLHFPPFERAGRVILTRYINKSRLASILESACYRKEILTEEVIEGYYNRAVRDGWDESLLAMTREMPGNVVDFPLSSLNHPVLIMRGQHDTWVSQESTDEWKDQMAGHVFWQVPEAGHLPMEEQPSLFNEAVLNFLRSIE